MNHSSTTKWSRHWENGVLGSIDVHQIRLSMSMTITETRLSKCFNRLRNTNRLQVSLSSLTKKKVSNQRIAGTGSLVRPSDLSMIQDRTQCVFPARKKRTQRKLGVTGSRLDWEGPWMWQGYAGMEKESQVKAGQSHHVEKPVQMGSRTRNYS
jgi:hypothetical protein